MKEIKKTWDFCLSDLYFKLLVAGAAGLLGIGAAFFFSGVLGKASFESLGPIFSLVAFGMTVFLMGIVEAQTVFYFMISMGRTRKAFFVSYGIVRIFHQLAGLILVLAVALLEWGLAAISGLSPVWEVTGWKLYTDVGTLALFVLGFPIVLLFLGILYIKFKGWIFIGFWLLSILGSSLSQYIIRTGDGGNLAWIIKSFEYFLRLAPIWHTLCGCAGCILLIGFSWLLVRKQANA